MSWLWWLALLGAVLVVLYALCVGFLAWLVSIPAVDPEHDDGDGWMPASAESDDRGGTP